MKQSLVRAVSLMPRDLQEESRTTSAIDLIHPDWRIHFEPAESASQSAKYFDRILSKDKKSLDQSKEKPGNSNFDP
jgi:hypothetical protein